MGGVYPNKQNWATNWVDQILNEAWRYNTVEIEMYFRINRVRIKRDLPTVGSSSQTALSLKICGLMKAKRKQKAGRPHELSLSRVETRHLSRYVLWLDIKLNASRLLFVDVWCYLIVFEGKSRVRLVKLLPAQKGKAARMCLDAQGCAGRRGWNLGAIVCSSQQLQNRYEKLHVCCSLIRSPCRRFVQTDFSEAACVWCDCFKHTRVVGEIMGQTAFEDQIIMGCDICSRKVSGMVWQRYILCFAQNAASNDQAQIQQWVQKLF